MTDAFRRGRARIGEMSWSYLFGLVFFLMTSGVILAMGASKGSPRAAIMSLAKAAVCSLMVAKLLSGGYGGVTRWRAARTWPARLAALTPSLLTGWMRMDRANFHACLAWLARRPQPLRPPGKAFGFGARSSYSTFVLIGMVSTFVDLPLNAFIASVMVHDPVIATRIHLVCLALAGYTLMWIMGDRWLMQGSSHVLGATVLDLKVAGRLAAQIPRSAIESCEAFDGGAAAWCLRHAVPRSATLTSTPADSANIVVVIDQDAVVQLTHWQVERPAPRYLFLYVDEPAQLAAAVRDHVQPFPERTRCTN